MTKTALALGGGGARGSYEIGVWEALSSLSVSPDIVTGTSVGALNAALIAQDDFETAKEIWLNIDTPKILGTQFEGRLKKGNLFNNVTAFAKEFIEKGGADAFGLHSLLCRYINEDKIRKNKAVLFGLVAVEFPSMRPQKLFINEIPRGKLIDYLMASSACFPAMHAYEMDGKAYVDGGYSDNLPAKMAIDKGAREIIAVSLSAPGIEPNIRAMKAVRQGDACVTFIKSRDHLGEILNFDSDTAAKNMRLGFLDTYKALNKLYGFYYSINRQSTLLDYLTKNLDGILEGAGIGDGGNKLLRYSLLRGLLRSLRGAPLTKTAAVVHSLDSAAQIYNIDSLEIYDFEVLCKKVMEKYRERGPSPYKSAALYNMLEREKGKVTGYAASRLLGFNRQDVVSSFAESLESAEDMRLAHLAATLFPSEFEAAVLIRCLNNLPLA